MRVPTLQKLSLLGATVVLCIEHVDWAWHIGEGRIQATCYQYAAIVEADGDWVGLEHKVFGNFLFGPDVFAEVVLED